MKKLVLIGMMTLGLAVSGWAGFPVRGGGEGNGDNLQPGPVSDPGPVDILPGPGIPPTVVVPEPSTISLLAVSGVISSWFFLRRKR